MLRLPRSILQTARHFSMGSPRLAGQNAIPAAYYRGGTSRAVMFRKNDLPSDQSKWPHIFRSVIGSPDPNGRQLDGMGGGLSSLSKVCVVGPSTESDADVDYTFVAVGVKNDEVDFSSNCGNMTSAVGPFAVDAGLVPRPKDGETSVLIRNTNTNKRIRATFPVQDGEAVADGPFAIDGVAGTASKIKLAFQRPSGSKTGKTLPTDKVVDTFDGVRATCIDVGNPCVFVLASELNVDGCMLADDITAHPTLLAQLDSIRRQAAVAMGLAKDTENVPGSIPKIAVVSEPRGHRLLSGETLDEKSCDVVVRAISVGQPHQAVPITVAMAIATASRLPGSIVNECVASSSVDKDGVTLGHNSGTILVGSKFDAEGIIEEAIVFRTARRIMEGKVYYK
ncbi:PrpF protein [Diaporthe sp. PMI_573]|nr:PrpF protein [Diaporthaceae sp. PMI_573]